MSLHITLLENVSSCIFYFGPKEPIKVPILILSSVLICQIPHFIFQTGNQFFFKFYMTPSVSWKISPLLFFRSNVIYFARKGPIKVQILETFECWYQNSPNSCHFWNNKSIFLQILHHLSVLQDITPLYTFLGQNYILCKKGTNQGANFGDFWMLRAKFTKFWSFFKQQIGFSSNFASLFSNEI